MFCLKCGAEIPNVSSFWFRCGTPLAAITGIAGGSHGAPSPNEPQQVQAQAGTIAGASETQNQRNAERGRVQPDSKDAALALWLWARFLACQLIE